MKPGPVENNLRRRYREAEEQDNEWVRNWWDKELRKEKKKIMKKRGAFALESVDKEKPAPRDNRPLMIGGKAVWDSKEQLEEAA